MPFDAPVKKKQKFFVPHEKPFITNEHQTDRFRILTHKAALISFNPAEGLQIELQFIDETHFYR